MRKFLISFGLGLIAITACASVQAVTETKLVAHKYTQNNQFKVQFYDGTVLTMDYDKWKAVQVNSEFVIKYATKH